VLDVRTSLKSYVAPGHLKGIFGTAAQPASFFSFAERLVLHFERDIVLLQKNRLAFTAQM